MKVKTETIQEALASMTTETNLLLEKIRLKKLRDLKILDTHDEVTYNNIVELAASITESPIALITFLDETRTWIKANHGMGSVESTARELSFCNYVIQFPNEPFIVEDVEKVEPLASLGHDNVKFYVGIPLVVDGSAIGTLCILDHKPKTIEEKKIKQLELLAKVVMSFINVQSLSR